MGGMVSLAQATFVLMAALTTGMLINRYEWAFLPAIIVGVAATVAARAASSRCPRCGWAASRSRSATLALAFLGDQVLFQWNWLRNMQSGWSDPAPGHRSLRHDTTTRRSRCSCSCSSGSPRSLIHNLNGRRGAAPSSATRSSEIAANTSGVSVLRVKLGVFALSAAIAGVGGVLYASYQQSITNLVGHGGDRAAVAGDGRAVRHPPAGGRGGRGHRLGRVAGASSVRVPHVVPAVVLQLERHRVGRDPRDPVRPRCGAAGAQPRRRHLDHRGAELRPAHEAQGQASGRARRAGVDDRGGGPARRTAPMPPTTERQRQRARRARVRCARDGDAARRRPARRVLVLRGHPRRLRRRRGAPRRRPRRSTPATITALLGAERQRQDHAVLHDLRAGAAAGRVDHGARRPTCRGQAPYQRARERRARRARVARHLPRPDGRGEPRAPPPGRSRARPGVRAVPGAARAAPARQREPVGWRAADAGAGAGAGRPAAASSSPTSRRSASRRASSTRSCACSRSCAIRAPRCCWSRRRRATCSRSRSRSRSWSSVAWRGAAPAADIDDERLLATYLGAGR